MDDAISAVTKLWQGNSCIETWEDTAYGILNVTYSTDVKGGKSYTVTVDYTINGIVQKQLSDSGTCN